MNSIRHCGVPRVERRQLLLGLAGVLGTTIVRSAKASSGKAGCGETTTRTSLRQQVEYPVAPDRIYAALTESEQFASLTGLAAQIDSKPGGAFSTFKGLVVGWNLDLLPGQRIVQAWRLTEEFDPGVYSLVHFELQAIDHGTRVTLDHTGFPEGHYDHLYEGWPKRYWNPLRHFIA